MCFCYLTLIGNTFKLKILVIKSIIKSFNYKTKHYFIITNISFSMIESKDGLNGSLNILRNIKINQF